ncbi:MAG TPA: hypothetical protein VMF89_21440, partial [Polyangiales bacterium]|nr:hypothetical protein [Polyangiales bacterium]
MLIQPESSRVRACLGAIAGLCAALLGGCSAMVREEHYFATYAKSDSPHEPRNFFRLEITGASTFSNARYIAGFYDPRAVDLFFNELKPQSSDRTLFSANLQLPGESTVLTPLSPGDRGTYVMVLSTNADAIADAIGSFSESQVV